jgi:dolichyl-phosphate beta-glucosyltransferase
VSGHSERPIYLSVIVPAYNEETRMRSSLQAIEDYLRGLGRSYEILPVNDGSTDGTLSAMREYAAGSDSVRVITYERNAGKGCAVRRGMMESRGEFGMFTDTDLSAPIDELPKLFLAIEQGNDIAIGSRAVRGSVRIKHQPFYRELGGKGLNLVIRALAVPGIHDTQCGFKLFKGELARRIFSRCFLDGWGFDVEVLYLARRLGYRIAEVPVVWSHAEGSKIHPFRAGLQVIRDLIRIRTHDYSL